MAMNSKLSLLLHCVWWFKYSRWERVQYGAIGLSTRDSRVGSRCIGS